MEKEHVVKVSPGRRERMIRDIDTIYALTTAEPYPRTWKGRGYQFQQLSAILVKRGVLLIKNYNSLLDHHYEWNPAAPAPTPVFYDSVIKELADREYKRGHAKYVKHHPENKPEHTPHEDEWMTYTESQELSSFADQQLWNELKRRGYSIVDNQIVRTTTLV